MKKQKKSYPTITETNREVKGMYLGDENFEMFSFKVIGTTFIFSSHSWLVESSSQLISWGSTKHLNQAVFEGEGANKVLSVNDLILMHTQNLSFRCVGNSSCVGLVKGLSDRTTTRSNSLELHHAQSLTTVFILFPIGMEFRKGPWCADSP